MHILSFARANRNTTINLCSAEGKYNPHRECGYFARARRENGKWIPTYTMIRGYIKWVMGIHILYVHGALFPISKTFHS